ncbi:hypothetical protein I6N95_18220 [Vagococcus sp. BWB3-3]|uniref:Uncharacterized protein n=1 Tax=Vagococcus allomyrinae TaxID=2794353 RepID=A0A940PHC9_9ENTE|nr:hypothetical protein [Vagococcus allomyrinae]MBP1042953.1 hypothetical protein [Vagococcus allomyrinae]
MRIEERWQDVTIFNVAFATTKRASIERLVILKNAPSDADVEAMIYKHLPNVVAVHHVDEWGTGLSLKESIDMSKELTMIGMEVAG